MPIQYRGVKDEHLCVRNRVGLFDVSHMGEFLIEGDDALSFLNLITCNNVNKIEVGKAQYYCLTNDQGGIVDDLIIYHLERNKYLLVVNAANVEKDWNWIKNHIGSFDINSTTNQIKLDFWLCKVRLPMS